MYTGVLPCDSRPVDKRSEYVSIVTLPFLVGAAIVSRSRIECAAQAGLCKKLSHVVKYLNFHFKIVQGDYIVLLKHFGLACNCARSWSVFDKYFSYFDITNFKY